MQFDRTGAFLVREVDRALGQTSKKGLPQLSIKVQVLHWYDEATGEWVDFSEYDMEGIGYFTLVFNGNDGPETSLSFDNIMKVYNWDGKDFQVLTEIAAPETFMFKIKDNDPEYAAKTPFVVSWIDTADADPRGGLKKLDAEGVKGLNAQFGALLNKAGKAAPPASAKKAPPIPPPKAAATPAPAPAEETVKKPSAADKKAAKKAKSDKVAADNARLKAEKEAKKTKVPPTPPPTTSTPPTPPEQVDALAETKTKQEAYELVYEMQAEGTTDDQRNKAWNAAIEQVAGDVDQKTITGEQWNQIMHETLNDVGAV